MKVASIPHEFSNTRSNIAEQILLSGSRITSKEEEEEKVCTERLTVSAAILSGQLTPAVATFVARCERMIEHRFHDGVLVDSATKSFQKKDHARTVRTEP